MVPRLSAALGVPPLGLVWEDTELQLSGNRAWRDVLTGTERPGGEPTLLADIFQTLPLAVFSQTRDHDVRESPTR